MSKATLYRLGGLAGLIGGAAVIVDALTGDTQFSDIVSFISTVFAMYALTALYLGQREQSGVLGGVGYIVNTLGLMVIVGLTFVGAFVFHSLPEEALGSLFESGLFVVFIVSYVVFVVGAILLGIATIRARVFPAWAAALYMVGFVASLLVVLVGLPDVVDVVGSAVAGVGIVGFGLGLWSHTD